MTPPLKGRGTDAQPGNRFEETRLERLDDAEIYASSEDRPAGPRTRFYHDKTRSILSKNKSPDVGCEYSFNPYRGCEHGCIYCYARPTHEYLGFSAGLDFESKIMVKKDAAKLLRAELTSPRWKPAAIMMSGNTDCYQPAEKHFRITRACLEVLRDLGNPVGAITKNHLITRDIDLFQDLAKINAACVSLSITTLDADLCGVMEPRTSRPEMRLQAIRELAAAGIPVGVNVAPVIPGLTDHELPSILKEAAAAGARHAGYTLLRLPHGVKDLFEEWVGNHFPDRKQKVLHRIRETRDGELYNSEFGTRMKGTGVYAEHIADLFRVSRRKFGFADSWPELSTTEFKKPGEQLGLL